MPGQTAFGGVPLRGKPPTRHNYAAQQQSLRMLDQALRESFKKKGGDTSAQRKGFPNFKSRKNHQASFTLTMVSTGNMRYKGEPLTLSELRNGIRDGTGCSSRTTFYVPKAGHIPFVFSRGVPSDFASCQIKQECAAQAVCHEGQDEYIPTWKPPEAGRWFLVLTVKKPKARRHPLNPHQPNKEVGIDINSKEYVFSDSTAIPMPKFFFGGFPVMGTPITFGANRLRGTRKVKRRSKSISSLSVGKRRALPIAAKPS